MKHNLKLNHFLFLAPLLIMLAIFSLYPIITSFVYSFFDYRTTNQQFNELRLGSALNGDLLAENASYVGFYLNDDYDLVDAEGQAVFDRVTEESDRIAEQYAGVTDISAADEEAIRAYIVDARQSIAAVYSRFPDEDFWRQSDLKAIFAGMERVFIESNYVGLEHYQRLLKDTRFFKDLGHTAFFTVMTVSLELILGMGLALIMNKAMRGIGLVRTAALIPWAIPTAVSALMWQYLYDGRSGIVANFFAAIGLIGSPEQMLSTSGGAMTAAIIADVWKTPPYMALLLLAGLQIIDRGLYESAAVDGSGAVHQFFHITLPLMKPSILVALLFRTLDAFRVYDLIAVLTGGGPGGSTETLSIYSYKVMIEQSNYGYGSAIVVGMFVFVAIIATVFIKFLGADLLSDS